MRLACVLLAVVVLLYAPCRAQEQVRAAGAGTAPAQPLAQGWWSFNVTAGYSGWALPVANSALGRDWARDSGVAWQLERNYSVIPVRVDIEHRFPYAFKGRIEIVSGHGYAREEDPLQHFTYLSQELLIPPSVPTTIILTPRVCPPSNPGAPVRLLFRLYQTGTNLPSEEINLTVTQLEPAYLYTLYLDGPPAAVVHDQLNPGNRLGLEIADAGNLDTSFVESTNYTISVDHVTVTRKPLAARDFAFVTADARQVAQWPREDQDGLAEYVLGGGYLCLFNCAGAGSWQGIALQNGPQEVGRGYLLPVAGGFSAARAAVGGWLEGELEELVLWAGGSSGGASLAGTRAAPLLDAQLAFGRRRRQNSILPPYTAAGTAGEIISHRPAYLNPVWLYREVTRHAALEPWDYPEFELMEQDVFRANRNLPHERYGEDRNVIEEDVSLDPLVNSAQPARRVPPAFLAFALLLPLAACFGRARRLWLAAAAFALLLAAGGVSWALARAQPLPQVRLTLLDRDARLRQTVARNLVAALSDRAGDASVALPEGSLVRRVSWKPAGDWRLETTRDGTRLVGTGGGPFMAVACDSQAPAVPPPVSVTAQRLAGGWVRITADTSRLEAGRPCLLVTRCGWAQLPGGNPSCNLYLYVPRVPVHPGKARLLAIAESFPAASPGLGMENAVFYAQGLYALNDLLSGRPQTAAGDELLRTAWSGILQNPLSFRGLLGNQAILMLTQPGGRTDAGQAREAGFVRLTIPLAGGAQ